MSNEKVIIDLAEFNRLKKIEVEIRAAFENKELIRLSFSQYGNNVCFKLVNESDAIKDMTQEIAKGKEVADSAWDEVILLRKELDKKKKWYHF